MNFRVRTMYSNLEECEREKILEKNRVFGTKLVRKKKKKKKPIEREPNENRTYRFILIHGTLIWTFQVLFNHFYYLIVKKPIFNLIFFTNEKRTHTQLLVFNLFVQKYERNALKFVEVSFF